MMPLCTVKVHSRTLTADAAGQSSGLERSSAKNASALTDRSAEAYALAAGDVELALRLACDLGVSSVSHLLAQQQALIRLDLRRTKEVATDLARRLERRYGKAGGGA